MNSYNEEVNKASARPWKDQFFDSEITRALSEKGWLAATVRADVLQRKAPQLDVVQLDSSLTQGQRDGITARAFLKQMFDDDGNYRVDIASMGNQAANPKGG